MSEGGFLDRKPRSPGSLALVIALHAAAITALALSKMEVPKVTDWGTVTVDHIPIEPDPEPLPPPPEPKLPVQRQDQVVTKVPPRVATPVFQQVPISGPAATDLPILDVPRPGPTEIVRAEPPPPPPAPAVRKEAQIDGRSQLQPPYPASEERAGNEGSVTVRVQIGADGRVKSIEKVRAASEAFWRATERHAMRGWRFKPATVDGKPIETTKVMTVHFQLRG